MRFVSATDGALQRADHKGVVPLHRRQRRCDIWMQGQLLSEQQWELTGSYSSASSHTCEGSPTNIVPCETTVIILSNPSSSNSDPPSSQVACICHACTLGLTLPF